jgi:ATP adenylyltransferase
MEYIKSLQKKEQECIFCQKPKESNDKENLIVYRSNQSFVILNKYPYNNGHLMVVPYIHESDMLELNDDVLLDMQHLLQLSVRALQATMNPHGLNIGMNLGRSAGAGIKDHLHYHIVPRWEGDTNYMPIFTGTKIVSEALADSWDKLHAAFKELS